MQPDALIVQDPTLLHQVDVFQRPEARRLRPDQQQQRSVPSSWVLG
jgi:hypothetical protein